MSRGEMNIYRGERVAFEIFFSLFRFVAANAINLPPSKTITT